MEKKQFEAELLDRYGELIGGALLSKVLGYASLDAMKRAIERKTLEIPTFFIKGRRGRYALTVDVANWLLNCKESAVGQVKVEPNQLRSK